ncbi:hypothetical protein Rhe02_30360 [Rhizocola hellebori]|uniref:DUF2029 domain-containing protein n=1 Tax=Rhizocola hellebori TaxID=1392758 RepID=A0A8J3Q7Q2_9ACTN|nr:hypothetical protein Rhe02_30360 [Rhizocola hellebori]
MAGAVLLAAAAALAGAHPGGDPGAGFRTGGFAAVPASFSVGLVCWLAGGVVLTVAWWKLPTPNLRTVLLTGALWALPILFAPPLGSRDVYAYACQGWLWNHGQDPYAVGVQAGGCPWFEAVPQLWWQTPTPYGPLAIALSGLAAAAGNLVTGIIVLRLLAVASVLVLAWQAPKLAVHCGLSPASAAWLGVVTPLILVHGLSAAHNDLLVAALVVTALTIAATNRSAALAAGRRHEEAAVSGKSRFWGAAKPRIPRSRDGHGAAQGARAGLWGRAVVVGVVLAGAVAVKVTAIAVVPFVFILLGRRWWAAAAGVVGGFAGLSLATGLDLGWVQALRGTGELAQWSSVPTAVGMTIGYLLRPFGFAPEGPIAVARVVGVAALAVLGISLLFWAWRHRTGTQKIVVASGLALAATAILGPVFYPWYAITPLAVLAASATDKRRWLAAATVICTFLTLPNGLGVPVLTKAVGAFAVTAALIVLVARRRAPARAA